MYSGNFEWPGGAYVAVVFNMAWETWPDDLASASSTQVTAAMTANSPYRRLMRPIYEHAFAETGGMQRLLDLWDRYEIRGSCYANGQTVARYPDLARAVAEHGHEVLAESWNHEFLYNLTLEEEVESLDRTVEAFKTVLGHPPAGFSSPGGHPTNDTFELIAERGFKYMCGLRNSEIPFIIHLKEGRTIVGMTSYAQSDFRTFQGEWTPRQAAEALHDSFDALYDEGRRGYPKMLPFGSHPFLAYGFRTRPLEEVIRYIKGHPHVWITTREQIADWVLENYSDMDLAHLYPGEAAISDAAYGLGIGLGGDAAEKRHAAFRESR